MFIAFTVERSESTGHTEPFVVYLIDAANQEVKGSRWVAFRRPTDPWGVIEAEIRAQEAGLAYRSGGKRGWAGCVVEQSRKEMLRFRFDE